ncbi:hypothetical protein [Deinococcus alpinitundrae]|uniref:hypothetical protein n=1 Tax=Deinococcus alpinitundrae TaxID=468913 RepID=UPI00137AB092|nr:hypothetical protein [Deinococcus alpinitundrae]
MTEFDALQHAVERSASKRQAETRACEAFLTALYHALRHASGPGLPLNNVTTEVATDPVVTLRPPPLGAWHAAWFRLGLCEVRVRVRRDGADFVGEYGPQGQFRLHLVSEADLLALGRQMMRHLTDLYESDAQPPRLKN